MAKKIKIGDLVISKQSVWDEKTSDIKRIGIVTNITETTTGRTCIVWFEKVGYFHIHENGIELLEKQ